MQTTCSARMESLQVNETKDFLQPAITATMSYHLGVVYTNPPLFFLLQQNILPEALHQVTSQSRNLLTLGKVISGKRVN